MYSVAFAFCFIQSKKSEMNNKKLKNKKPCNHHLHSLHDTFNNENTSTNDIKPYIKILLNNITLNCLNDNYLCMLHYCHW